MPFLSPVLWPWWIGGLLAVLAAEAVLQLIVYLNRRWTVALAIANAVLNLIVAVAAIWLLAQGHLLNPEFWTTVIPAPDAENVFGIISVIAGFGIAGVSIWGAVDA
ncbi:hypothetical protein, partial [Pseudomonas sp. PS02285]|uniref:hypothetical protein n=1 Tax=Pseudomonas sp. PS02285 TaxID=2991441 RepID=UPI00249BD8AD